jgi:ribosomal protein L24E
MRTYDDTFSGEKIYPGKVRFPKFCGDQVAKD